MEKAIVYESDQALLDALRRGVPAAFETLYRNYYRMVARQVNDAGTESTDVQDLFQEVLLILVRQIKDPGFQLTAKLSTYLYAIARNLLYKKNGRKSEYYVEDTALLRLDVSPDEEDPDERARHENQLNIVTANLELLEDDCRKVLQLSFYDKINQSEIATIMGYAESFVKVKKHRCLEYLRKRVKSHPLFNPQ